jgi:hypothetical protein
LARFAIAIVVIFELLVSLLLAFYILSPLTDRAALPFFGSHIADTVIFSIALCGMLSVIVGLFWRSKWAWWVSVAGSTIVAIFGLLLGWLTLHPRDAFAASEDGFGIAIAGILVIPSVLSLIWLGIPQTREHFRGKGPLIERK